MIRLSSRLKESSDSNLKPLVIRAHHTFGGIIKRAFDFAIALFGLLLLLPLFVLIGFLIKRDSPGPVFYWAPRIGRKAAIFKMLKFRTMYEEAKSYRGLRVTCKEDERITQVGKWLRDTKLNELPQLWNVLIGEMSLVGPRPEDPDIARTWPAKIARELLSVRPGITSPASVLYRDEENMLHAGDVMRKYLHELSPDKMRLDQLYIRYRSFWLDLDVILWTALLVLPKLKVSSPPEQFLFVGPFTRLIKRYIRWFVWDFAVVLLSIGLIGVFLRLFGPLDIGLVKSIEMALGYSLLYSIFGAVLSANLINWPKATSWESIRLWLSWLIATIATISFHYYLGLTTLRISGLILGASVLSLAGIIFVRYRERLVSGILTRLATHQLNSRALRERVLIVGSGRTAEHIAWLLNHPTYSRKFQIAGFIDNDLLSQGMKIYGSKVVGKVEDIQRIVKERDVGLIILADNRMTLQKYTEFRNLASFSPARVVVAPDIFGSLSGLDDPSSGENTKDDLNDFQCQYCLARYTNHQPGSEHSR